MTTVSTENRAGPGRAGIGTLARIGLRELRSGFGGFYVFIACLALGVAVIAAVGALADALRAGFEKQGQAILGGDVTFARMHNRASDQERALLSSLGEISETSTMRTMARRLDGSDQALAELKSVDGRYPLAGDVTLKDGLKLADALANSGAAVDGVLLERLGLKPGDKFKLADFEVDVRGIVEAEPDAVVDRLTYGPRVFISQETLEKTGLVKPGTLIRWRYGVKLPPGAATDKDDLKALRTSTLKQMPESGFSALDRHDPSPQLTRTLDRLRQFLILIGLASLLVGGVGIANAVATFVAKRMKVIATLRSFGATGPQIVGIFLVQVLAMSAVGIVIGLIAGMLVPGLVDKLVGETLPVRAEFAISPRSLGIAAIYGVLASLLFALWPLGRAEHVKATALFRNSVQPLQGMPRAPIFVAVVVLALVLLGVAVSTSDPPRVAFFVAAGLAVMLAVFSLLGAAVSRLAQRVPRPASPVLALAVRNIGAPDGLTRAVVLSLGTGLSLLVAVALTNASLLSELKGRLPDKSPDYFLLDVPKQDYPALLKRVEDAAPGAELTQAPMLRGRLLKLHGTPVEDIIAPPEAQWVLSGDRGLTYLDHPPEGSKVVEGAWWPDDYAGPPLVSFDKELARLLGLKIGDSVTVNVLGRNVDATIANLREVKWETLALNFVMVFSPNTLQAAPHNLLATIRLPKGQSGAGEARMVHDLAKAYPSVSAIRVRDAIGQFNKIFSKIMIAVQVAGSVTLAAGALVLAGALATAQRRRVLEAVVLKVIGARRSQILKAHAWEYSLLALAAALVAVALGTLWAWVAVTQVMEIPFTFSSAAVWSTLAIAGLLMAVFGGLGTFAVLRAPAVPHLRSE